ncbi:MAG: hypothetical protein PVH19_11750 [Planctomycetia bacterium]
MRTTPRLRLRAAVRTHLLCRFVCRFCFAPDGRLEVLVSRHQVMPHGNARSVPKPACDHLHGIRFDQFRFSACS